MFDVFVNVKDSSLNYAKIPKHLAMNIAGVTKWAERENIPLADAFKRSFAVMEDIIRFQVKLNIPILTFFVLPETSKKSQQFSVLLDCFVQFLDRISFGELVNKNKIKVTILGKWYDLPGRAVDRIKSIIEESKDYDTFFLNFCVNYNGQEEIVDSCKIIAKKVAAKKLDPDDITKETIKDNIYSSYFIPPDLIVKNGVRIEQDSLLLWDSIHAHIYFSRKLFPDLTISELKSAIKEYQKNKD